MIAAALRQGMMGGKKLPYKRELAYLEADADQYIDTGYLFNVGDVFELDVCSITPASPKYNVSLFGFMPNWDGGRKGAIHFGSFYSYNRAQFGLLLDDGATFVKYEDATSGTWYHIVFDNSDGENVVVSYNGEEVFNRQFAMRTTDKYPFYLFRGNFWGSASTVSGLTRRHRSFSATRGGNKVIDLIPVLDLADRPAMYDKVSGELFYNQGTGEFTWGELET